MSAFKLAISLALLLIFVLAFLWKESFQISYQNYTASDESYLFAYISLGLYIFLVLYPARKFVIFLFSPRLKYRFLRNPDRYNKEYKALQDEIVKVQLASGGKQAEQIEEHMTGFLKSLGLRHYFSVDVQPGDGDRFKIQLTQKPRLDALGNFLFWHSVLGVLMGVFVYLHAGFSRLNMFYWFFISSFYLTVLSGLINALVYEWAPARFKKLEKQVPYNKSVFKVNQLVTEIIESLKTAAPEVQELCYRYIILPLNNKGSKNESKKDYRTVVVSEMPEEARRQWDRLVAFRENIDQTIAELAPFRRTQLFLNVSVVSHAVLSSVSLVFIIVHLGVQWYY